MIKKICKLLYRLSLKGLGVNRNGGIYKNGESYLISNLPNPKVIFDVGASVGMYTNCLCDNFHNAEIYAFEPMKTNFKKLKDYQEGGKIKVFNVAIGSKKGFRSITYPKWDVANDGTSSLPSLYDIFEPRGDLEEEGVSVITIDDFCEEHKIKNIDFMKIDVEGGELEVLKGAKRMIREGRIKRLTFEFNSIHAYVGVHMEDFRRLLKGYTLYRILPKGLYKLNFSGRKIYTEIYGYQNILAVKE